MINPLPEMAVARGRVRPSLIMSKSTPLPNDSLLENFSYTASYIIVPIKSHRPPQVVNDAAYLPRASEFRSLII